MERLMQGGKEPAEGAPGGELGAQRGARVYASTAGYPDMLEFWADLGMGTFALSPGDAVEACAAMTVAAV